MPLICRICCAVKCNRERITVPSSIKMLLLLQFLESALYKSYDVTVILLSSYQHNCICLAVGLFKMQYNTINYRYKNNENTCKSQCYYLLIQVRHRLLAVVVVSNLKTRNRPITRQAITALFCRQLCQTVIISNAFIIL